MAELTDGDDVREAVRDRHARAAKEAGQGGGCCGPAVSTTDKSGTEVFGAALYDEDAPETVRLRISA